MNNDDWELFVPVKGEMYPDNYQVKLFPDTPWQEGGSPGRDVKDPACFLYRKPKQKEIKMSDRSPQQALKDAIASGAVEAWINGEEIEYRAYGSIDKWTPVESPWPDFALHGLEYRPKPPKPTKIDWKPVVTGKEPEGTVLGTWEDTVQSCCYRDGKWYRTVDGFMVSPPCFWAPMCNLPE